MFVKKEKLYFLIIGLSIGFIIGCSYVWWNKNSIMNWTLINRLKNQIYSFFDNSLPVVIKEKNHQTVSDSYNSETSNNYNNYKTNNITNDSLVNDKYLFNKSSESKDILIIDTLNKSNDSYDNVVVMNDELLFTKSIKLTKPNIYQKSISANNADSLLLENSNESDDNSNEFVIEFWKSPVNYKGYKIGKNKLILFGIYQYDFTDFIQFNNFLFMKYMNNYYQIENTTNEFFPLIPINNNFIINQLDIEYSKDKKKQ